MKPTLLTLLLMQLVSLLCVGLAASRANAQFAVQQDIVAMYLFNGVDEKTYRQQLESKTSLRVDRVVLVGGLDESQAEKLRLAVKGDLSRFYRELAVVREKTKGLDLQNQAHMQQAWQEISPLQQKTQQGLLGEKSLFERVMAATLTPEQRLLYGEYTRERQKSLCLAIVRMTVADLEKSMPLLATQRAELMKLLETQPFPRTVPQGTEAFVGYVMLSKVKSTDLATILDEKQMKVIKDFGTQYAGFAGNFKW